jgi:putative transposase
MPSPHVLKDDRPDSFYHIYVPAAVDQLFVEPADYDYFVSLLVRYLSDEPLKNSAGIPYGKVYGQLDLAAYTLLDTSIHLLIHQEITGSMQRLMRGVLTGYSRYFNTKYKRQGSLYRGRYRASRLSNEPVALQASRYIHRLPHNWQTYPYSSLSAYADPETYPWLATGLFASSFANTQKYWEFIADGQAAERSLLRFGEELASPLPAA